MEGDRSQSESHSCCHYDFNDQSLVYSDVKNNVHSKSQLCKDN